MPGDIHLEQISEVEWEIPQEGDMQVPARIFASPLLLEGMRRDKCLHQARNMATLVGAVHHVVALSDAHQGYGFPIGGVAAFDAKDGIISPGGVGYDINCGVRLLATDIPVSSFMKRRSEVLRSITHSVPSGVGRGGREYSRDAVLDVLRLGAEWAVGRGLGTEADLDRTEEGGRMRDADPREVSSRALDRGLPQLGTLGAGNHFVELQRVEQVFDETVAGRFGLVAGNVAVMIHCGSRGLGHQVASDYIRLMEDKCGFKHLPDRELVNAPIGSELGTKYLQAMNCAVNFAFCNRQMIMQYVREAIRQVCGPARMSLVYDVCHNVAKIESHEIDGTRRTLCVHRKGATRSFGPGRKEIPSAYRDVGQPVIIPGSMGTASYVLVGTKRAEAVSFGSAAHGAGRVESRTQARNSVTAEQVLARLRSEDVEISAASRKGIVEESPDSYKDIDEVVRASCAAELGRLVARLRPLAVLKG